METTASLSGGPTPSPVLAGLRAATTHLHDRSEAALDLPSRLRSRRGYAGLLTGMLGILEPMEEAVSGFDWPSAGLRADCAAWRATRLRADLGALGVPADGLPRCLDVPRPTCRDAAFGHLYVLEGSALGGQIVSRKLEEALGIRADNGGSFYAADGRPPVGETWRHFRAALERHCARPDLATAAAVGCFAALERWLLDGAAAAGRNPA